MNDMNYIKLFENYDLNESLDNTQDFLEVFVSDNFSDVEYKLDDDEIRGTGKVALIEVKMKRPDYTEAEKQIDENYDLYLKDIRQAATETLPKGESEVEVSTIPEQNTVVFTIVYEPSFER